MAAGMRITGRHAEAELGHGVALDHQPADWISGHEVAHDADLLFHDAQYDDEEYPSHVGAVTSGSGRPSVNT